MLAISPIYLALLAVLYAGLSLRVIFYRKSARVALGDADDKQFQKLIRAHANFAEYTPIVMILLVVSELQGMPGWLIHLAGSAMFLGRLAHAWGISQPREPLWARQLGMVITLMLILILALGNLGHAIF